MLVTDLYVFTLKIIKKKNKTWKEKLFSIKIFSADTTMFSNYFFLTTKSWKNRPEKVLITSDS